MSYLDTAAALNSELATISGFTDAIAWPNMKFNPGDGDKYLEAALLPNESDVSALGSTEQNLRGLYQVLCKRRANKGIGALTDADAVRALFLPGYNFTSGTTTVRINKSWASPAFIDGDWYVVPVTIDWYTFA